MNPAEAAGIGHCRKVKATSFPGPKQQHREEGGGTTSGELTLAPALPELIASKEWDCAAGIGRMYPP